MNLEKSIQQIKDIQAEMNTKIENVLNNMLEIEKSLSGNYDVIFTNLVEEYFPEYKKLISEPIYTQYAVIMNGNILKIKFPAANKNWSLAIMKACIKFCERELVGSYPSFSHECDRFELCIRLVKPEN